MTQTTDYSKFSSLKLSRIEKRLRENMIGAFGNALALAEDELTACRLEIGDRLSQPILPDVGKIFTTSVEEGLAPSERVRGPDGVIRRGLDDVGFLRRVSGKVRPSPCGLADSFTEAKAEPLPDAPEMDAIKRGDLWHHIASNKLYEIISICRINLRRAVAAPAVAYRAFNRPDSEIWVRPLSEFLDGRFVRISAPDGAKGQHEDLTLAQISRRAIMSSIADVAAERLRQLEVEGFTPEHDAGRPNGTLAKAAAAYAGFAFNADQEAMPGFFPFSVAWWKPGNPRRNLVKAAALILAEIDRMDDLDARQKDRPGASDDHAAQA